MNPHKKNGRPTKKETRRYKQGEKGTRVFNIEDLVAEIPAKINPSNRGTLYVGTEFKDHDVIIMVLRKKHDETNNV